MIWWMNISTSCECIFWQRALQGSQDLCGSIYQAVCSLTQMKLMCWLTPWFHQLDNPVPVLAVYLTHAHRTLYESKGLRFNDVGPNFLCVYCVTDEIKVLLYDFFKDSTVTLNQWCLVLHGVLDGDNLWCPNIQWNSSCKYLCRGMLPTTHTFLSVPTHTGWTGSWSFCTLQLLELRKTFESWTAPSWPSQWSAQGSCCLLQRYHVWWLYPPMMNGQRLGECQY